MNPRRIRTKLALGTLLGLAAAGTGLAAAAGTGPLQDAPGRRQGSTGN